MTNLRQFPEDFCRVTVSGNDLDGFAAGGGSEVAAQTRILGIV